MNGKNLSDIDCFTFTQVNIIFNSRLFWRELIYWTRGLFNSVFFHIADADKVFARLFEVSPEYANTLRFIISRRDADQFRLLFNQYVVLLQGLLSGVFAGDMDQVNARVSDLYRNARARAEYLAEIFPSLDEAVIEEMLNTMIAYEIMEINANIEQDYTGIINIYDRLIAISEDIADYIAQGVINLITAAPMVEDLIEEDLFEELCIDYDMLRAILDISMFWIDLVAWARTYRISIMVNRPNQAELLERLMRVITDYGDALKNFLDDEIVDAHVEMMQEYILLMDRLMDARLEGNIAEMNRIYQLTIDNIDERAMFLNAIFPSQSETQWRNQLIKLHTSLIEMATEFLTGDYGQSIVIFDGLIDQAEDMGSFFIEGLLIHLINNQNAVDMN